MRNRDMHSGPPLFFAELAPAVSFLPETRIPIIPLPLIPNFAGNRDREIPRFPIRPGTEDRGPGGGVMGGSWSSAAG